VDVGGGVGAVEEALGWSVATVVVAVTRAADEEVRDVVKVVVEVGASET
jgi:hypothetical protein